MANIKIATAVAIAATVGSQIAAAACGTPFYAAGNTCCTATGLRFQAFMPQIASVPSGGYVQTGMRVVVPPGGAGGNTGNSVTLEGPFVTGTWLGNTYTFPVWDFDGFVSGTCGSPLFTEGTTSAAQSPVPTSEKWYSIECSATSLGMSPCTSTSQCHFWQMYQYDPGFVNPVMLYEWAPTCPSGGMSSPGWEFTQYGAGEAASDTSFHQAYEYRTSYAMGSPTGNLGTSSQAFLTGPEGFRTGYFKWTDGNWYLLNGGNATASLSASGQWSSSSNSSGAYFPFISNTDLSEVLIDTWNVN